MFNVETEMTTSLTFGDAVVVGEPVSAAVAKFDLTLSLASSGGGLAGGFEYRTDLFDSATIGRMAGHFLRLLKAAVEDPEAPATHLAMLPDEERQPQQRRAKVDLSDVHQDVLADGEAVDGAPVAALRGLALGGAVAEVPHVPGQDLLRVLPDLGKGDEFVGHGPVR
jgi:non-ribosomal peptide synthetase component F